MSRVSFWGGLALHTHILVTSNSKGQTRPSFDTHSALSLPPTRALDLLAFVIFINSTCICKESRHVAQNHSRYPPLDGVHARGNLSSVPLGLSKYYSILLTEP